MASGGHSQSISPGQEIKAEAFPSGDKIRILDTEQEIIRISTRKDTSGKLFVNLEPDQPGSTVYYTLNGDELSSDDPVFIEAFELSKSKDIQYGIFEMGELVSGVVKNRIVLHQAIGKNSELRKYSGEALSMDASPVLLDGILGNENYMSGQWLGFKGFDMNLVIDLGDFHYVESVTINFMNFPQAHIFMPRIVKFYYSGNDINYKQVGEVKYKQHEPGEQAEIMEYQMDYPWIETRYIMITAENIKKCPPGHPEHGKQACIMADEVIVE
ncbi:MAG: hypothetical protein U5Q03_19450 [Bacteroidota bacterium]|nr:hypothetical protein [Bacteroidota bacterium]